MVPGEGSSPLTRCSWFFIWFSDWCSSVSRASSAERRSTSRSSASVFRRSPSSPTSPGHVTPPAPRRDSSSHQPPHSPSDPHRGLADGAGGPPPSQHGNKGGGSDTLPRSRARSPDAGRQPLDVDSAGESLERRTNDSESGDELSGSSTEHLQVRERERERAGR